jgi:hypothetical protein
MRVCSASLRPSRSGCSALRGSVAAKGRQGGGNRSTVRTTTARRSQAQCSSRGGPAAPDGSQTIVPRLLPRRRLACERAAWWKSSLPPIERASSAGTRRRLKSERSNRLYLPSSSLICSCTRLSEAGHLDSVKDGRVRTTDRGVYGPARARFFLLKASAASWVRIGVGETGNAFARVS